MILSSDFVILLAVSMLAWTFIECDGKEGVRLPQKMNL